MEGGIALFRKDVKYCMYVDGKVNGVEFKVEGEGTGYNGDGYQKGKFICTTGQLPISWAALASTLGYGYKCFSKYPNGLANFFQESMPEGYTQDRTVTYENDGVLTIHHDLTYEKGVVINRATFNAEGFKSDSPVLNNGIGNCLPSAEVLFPWQNGLRGIVSAIYPLKNPAPGGDKYIVARVETTHLPIVKNREVKLPGYHHLRAHLEQFQDVDDSRDHVVLHESLEGCEQSLLSF